MDAAAPLSIGDLGFWSVVIQVGIVAVALLWALVPFALFGVRVRLEKIVDTQQRHGEMLAEELQRFGAILTSQRPDDIRSPAPDLEGGASGRFPLVQQIQRPGRR